MCSQGTSCSEPGKHSTPGSKEHFRRLEHMVPGGFHRVHWQGEKQISAWASEERTRKGVRRCSRPGGGGRRGDGVQREGGKEGGRELRRNTKRPTGH